MTESAVWVYAISRPPTQVPAVTGVSGEPVRLVEQGRLAAAVGSVSLDEYGEQALRRSLEDLAWLDAKARSHHRVISALAEAGTVVPMRLAILFENDGRVRQMLTESQQQIEAALATISGRSEWGLKVFASRSDKANMAETNADRVSTPESEVRGGKVGTAYLERRRAGLEAREESRRSHATTAQSVYDAARHFAVAGRRHAVQDATLSGESREMLLNAAFLIPDERCDDFVAAIRALAGTPDGIDIQVTGPWPPYSFTWAGESP